MLVLTLQAILVAGVLLVLFRLRSALGMVPLYVFLGAMQVLQTVASSVLVPVGDGILVPPGSAVLFSASLFVVLMVYIREDATETRRLIYALAAANGAISLLLVTLAWQAEQPGMLNFSGMAPETFVQTARNLAVGSVLLVIDAFLLVVVYEWMARRLPGLFAPMGCTLVLVLTLDSLAYASFAFHGHADFAVLLTTSVVSKAVAGLWYAMCSALYLHHFEREPTLAGHAEPRDMRDAFSVLSYRQKYERAEAAAMRDGLTGVYNRVYFNAFFAPTIEAAVAGQQALAVLFVDMDHFKRINDSHGHVVGDRILVGLAETMSKALRATDWVCRYGGEEFVVVLPGANPATAARIAEDLRHKVGAWQGVPDLALSVSIGVATLPEDGTQATVLLQTADRRLYAGKRAGRNRVVIDG